MVKSRSFPLIWLSNVKLSSGTWMSILIMGRYTSPGSGLDRVTGPCANEETWRGSCKSTGLVLDWSARARERERERAGRSLTIKIRGWWWLSGSGICVACGRWRTAGRAVTPLRRCDRPHVHVLLCSQSQFHSQSMNLWLSVENFLGIDACQWSFRCLGNNQPKRVLAIKHSDAVYAPFCSCCWTCSFNTITIAREKEHWFVMDSYSIIYCTFFIRMRISFIYVWGCEKCYTLTSTPVSTVISTTISCTMYVISSGAHLSTVRSIMGVDMAEEAGKLLPCVVANFTQFWKLPLAAKPPLDLRCLSMQNSLTPWR